METLTIDVLNPKVKKILDELEGLELIRIRPLQDSKTISQILSSLRNSAEQAPSLEEITKEVEAVRSARYEK